MEKAEKIEKAKKEIKKSTDAVVVAMEGPSNTTTNTGPSNTMSVEEFTGIARSVVCYYNQGNNNYKISTLHIDKGIIKEIKLSDPYRSFELESQLETATKNSLFHIYGNWEDKKVMDR